ncbi:MAG TPA: CopG family transcriptional regulator [Pirellulales bacterium]|nr:CopG family transcriptional regulator [Pirellulales bacterium]
MTQANSKKYWQMSARELAAATADFNEPLIVDRSRPLTAREREQWKQLKRKKGRPKVGKGHQRVSISIEKDLLKRATALAKKRKLSRSRLVALALEQALAMTP